MIRKANITWNAKQIAKSIEKGNITFENIVQRTLVWDVKHKSLLIHSMIVGFPMGPIFAAKNENKYDILDGKQRLTTIKDFMQDKFALTDIPEETEIEMDYGHEVIDLNGMKFSELPENVQEAIQDYSLTVYYFDGLTDEEVNEMFFRLNNGKPLSAIELTRVKTKDIEAVRKLAQHELFTSSMTKAAMAKYANEDIVMKSYVLLKDKNSDLSTKTVREKMEGEVWNEDDVKELDGIFNTLLHAYQQIDDKKVKRKIVTRIHLISLVPVIQSVLRNGLVDESQLISWMKEFFDDKYKTASISERYNQYVGAGSARKEAVIARYEEMEKSLNDFLVE